MKSFQNASKAELVAKGELTVDLASMGEKLKADRKLLWKHRANLIWEHLGVPIVGPIVVVSPLLGWMAGWGYKGYVWSGGNPFFVGLSVLFPGFVGGIFLSLGLEKVWESFLRPALHEIKGSWTPSSEALLTKLRK